MSRPEPRVEPDAALLTPAERAVVAGLRQGLTKREIATYLGKSVFTVKNQVGAILTKLGVPTRARLMALCTDQPCRGPRFAPLRPRRKVVI